MNRTRGGRPTEFDDARLPVPVAGRPAADQMTDVVVIGSSPGALAAAEVSKPVDLIPRGAIIPEQITLNGLTAYVGRIQH